MVTLQQYQQLVALQMSEKEWQDQVIKLATRLGWMCYHTWNSQHSAKGFPDTVMIRRNRLIVAELKSEKGTLTLPQTLWLEAFRSCNIETYVWIAFIANFIKLLAEEKMPYPHAQQAALAAASCLFAAVFELCPRDDTEVEDFSVPVIRAALNSFYGLQADRAILN